MLEFGLGTDAKKPMDLFSDVEPIAESSRHTCCRSLEQVHSDGETLAKTQSY